MPEPFIVDNALNIWLLAHACSVIAVHTQSAGPPPRGWSDHFLATQQLSIMVDETLCGEPVSSKTLVLSVPVVKGSRIANTEPGLAPWITRPGSRAVYFLQNNQVQDEDLGILPADPELLRWIRSLCSRPVPAGPGAVLYLLSHAGESDPAVASAFAGLDGLVADFVDPAGRTARLTIAKSKLRVFTGVRFQRIASSRSADVTIHASAEELARVLTGIVSAKLLTTTDNNIALMEALDKAGKVNAANADRTREIKAAAAGAP